MPGPAITITVAGKIDDEAFQQARVITENLCAVRAEITGDIVEMVEAEWDYYIEEKGRELAALGAGNAYDHKSSPIVYYNGCNYIGGLTEYLDWVAKRYEYEDQTSPQLYTKYAKKEYARYLESLGHQFVWFDISTSKDSPARRVTFELYTDIAPKTCENFRALCTGEKGSAGATKLHYKGNKFHRIVKNGWVQAGDIVSSDCAGDGSTSIYGDTFPDESFAIKQNGPGILSMANCGAHTNGSQFFVSLRALDWLDSQVVAFGRVISGMDVIRDLGSVETENERPVEDAQVVDCGQLKPGLEEEEALDEAKTE
jgi:cyclophilin family peptidyl-prolyl cis-trans isomerase